MKNEGRQYCEYREDGVLLLTASVEPSPTDASALDRDLLFLEKTLFMRLRDAFLANSDRRKHIRTKPHHVRITYTTVENGGECLSYLQAVSLFLGGKRLSVQEIAHTVDTETHRALPPTLFLPRSIWQKERKRIGRHKGFLVYSDRLVFFRDNAPPVTVKRKEDPVK